MYFFDRKTMYFVWYREDGQAKSVGSAQLTAVENVCRIEVSVTNCGRMEGEFPCYLLSGPVESLLGMIRLQKGKGTLSVRCDADKVGHAQLPYGKLTGIHIDLKGDGYLEQKWLPTGPCTEAQTKRAVVAVDEPERVIGDIMPYRRKENDVERNIESQRETNSEREPEEKTYREQIPEERGSERKLEAETHRERSVIEDRTEEKAGETGNEEVERKENKDRKMSEASDQKKSPDGRKKERMSGQEPGPVQLYTDKWQQLCAIYPIVHPFGDARGYLSIEPRDFVILQEQYQIMVQNSFLLHGFYNYRHLLLGRRRGERGMEYYLGVPGVLYEKERAAALFYGFEAFESAAVPAKDGNFGYYMKRVKI